MNKRVLIRLNLKLHNEGAALKCSFKARFQDGYNSFSRIGCFNIQTRSYSDQNRNDSESNGLKISSILNRMTSKYKSNSTNTHKGTDNEGIEKRTKFGHSFSSNKQFASYNLQDRNKWFTKIDSSKNATTTRERVPRIKNNRASMSERKAGKKQDTLDSTSELEESADKDVSEQSVGWRTRRDEWKRLGNGHWNPKKKVSRETMEKMRMLHNQYPDVFDIKRLSTDYRISFEAVRRILRSKFTPTDKRAQKQELNRKGNNVTSEESIGDS
ncbi:Required for respiratory growth protein 9, mitochondrial [Zancudomyces culisetae]|uniref:Required for respiratory growth protein 9, mitochondrial n=1 Tax=Zancudomyces culisetae TaxID=1213189 RepID=A0A1R1PGF9_ZANCU|nr:Required for respiratory growth protein 9, mitochondrial [Zancudomyces culisetae]|eukprot:OMH80064.1 Required for respiratory growth protein 9, mitochondrial [Zancudomyces culisetae]